MTFLTGDMEFGHNRSAIVMRSVAGQAYEVLGFGPNGTYTRAGGDVLHLLNPAGARIRIEVTNLDVIGALALTGAMTFTGALGLTGNLTLTGDLTQTGTFALTGAATVSLTLAVMGNVGIGAAASANADLKLESGRLMLKESATPTADSGYGKIYTKTDDLLYFQDGAGTEHTVSVSGAATVFKAYAAGDFGNAAIHYLAGFYEAPAAHVVLTIGGSVTQTYGTAGRMKAAHAFVVASGAGGTDLVLTVTGVSIAEDGTKNDSDSEVIVADTDAASTDEYFETTKKWLGQITYTLTGSAGAFTFNYGFAKYDDFGNRDFTLTDFEAVFKGAASETGLDVQLLHHNATGWTYSAAAFEPGNTPIVSSLTDFSSTNDNTVNGEYFAYKRIGLSTVCSGSTSEGALVKIVTAVNNSIRYGDIHIGVTL